MLLCEVLNNQKGAIQLFKKRDKQEEKRMAEPLSPALSDSIASYYRELCASDYRKQISFVGVTADDLQRLASVRPLFAKYASEMVAAFYEQIGQMPDLVQIIQHHSTIDRLKKTLHQYLMDMVSGEIGEQYIVRRKMIGHIHNRIGLLPEWYLGAYTIIQREVLKIVTKELPTDDAFAVYDSFLKLCSLDMQLAITAYIESYTSSMMKLHEIEELQHRLAESSMTLASSAEETTACINETERNVQSMLDELNEIERQSAEMVERVQKGKRDVAATLTKLDRVAEFIEQTKTLTHELTDNSRQIGAIVTAIRGISTQTHILSLNANIEAARAGEQGKGFAVVANEVRKLAAQTQQSLDYIQHHIDAVQQTIRKFENAFQRIVTETGAFRTANESIIHIFEQLAAAVQSSSEKIRDFTTAAHNFQETFRDISKASYQIAEMAEQLHQFNSELADKAAR